MKEKEATIAVSLSEWTEKLEELNTYKNRVGELELTVSVLWQEIANLRNREITQ